MKIVSKWKDYYDYISHQYGADLDCTYVRKSRDPLAEYKIPFPSNYFKPKLKLSYDRAFGLFSSRSHYYTCSYILAGEYVFPILSKYTWRYHKGVGGYEFDSHILVTSNEYDLFESDVHHQPLLGEIPPKARLNELIQTVGVPVFELKRFRDYLHVERRIPVLKDYGVPALVSADQMWQSIYSTLINVLRKNPDKEPPAKTEEKYRIEAAGFDLKTSFRHPIKL